MGKIELITPLGIFGLISTEKVHSIVLSDFIYDGANKKLTVLRKPLWVQKKM